MGIETDTKERLLACAKEEFLANGFQKASLRTICAKADVTTGAVYFLFHDKEGLFSALVEPAYRGLMAALAKHFAEDAEEDFTTYVHTPGDHDDFAEMLINALYADYDAVTLLLTCAAGSKYENIVDQIIALLEQNFGAMAVRYAASTGREVNPFMTHWLSHMSVMAYVHLITHERDREQALRDIKPVMEHIIVGWLQYAVR
ncbi:MAG: TetR/AcrR family transcriptional regulator [Lachnospiraceae bacterium]|nr:TetR/AcrR family transcriptional regulator [Lachnospiraceae bacterium]